MGRGACFANLASKGSDEIRLGSQTAPEGRVAWHIIGLSQEEGWAIVSTREQKRAHGKVTLQEVAHRAGVSPMTVSNFINDKFQFMSEATRQRVAAAVAVLNYRPDTAGRSLRSARHKSVGMIVVDESPLYLSDGSTTQVVSGLGNALNAEGYTLQIEGLRARDLERSSL